MTTREEAAKAYREIVALTDLKGKVVEATHGTPKRFLVLEEPKE